MQRRPVRIFRLKDGAAPGAARLTARAAALALLLSLAAAAAALALGSQPAIEEITASKITSHSAEIQAKIDPNGAKTEYTFFLEYKICQGSGVCNELWRQTEVGAGDIKAGTKGVTVSVKPNLAPGCDYEYHVVTSNKYGSSHTGEHPGERDHEFLTKRVRSLPEPHECTASG
jgi:hypothetical protein